MQTKSSQKTLLALDRVRCVPQPPMLLTMIQKNWPRATQRTMTKPTMHHCRRRPPIQRATTRETRLQYRYHYHCHHHCLHCCRIRQSQQRRPTVATAAATMATQTRPRRPTTRSARWARATDARCDAAAVVAAVDAIAAADAGDWTVTIAPTVRATRATMISTTTTTTTTTTATIGAANDAHIFAESHEGGGAPRRATVNWHRTIVTMMMKISPTRQACGCGYEGYWQRQQPRFGC